MNKISKIVLICSLSLMVIQIQAQEDDFDKQVVVFGNYNPSLSDAYRINVMPELKDSFERKAITDYEIRPIKLNTGLIDLRPIKPAKLMPESVSKLYRSQLTLGVGNYWMPFLELTSSNLRSNDIVYDIWAKNHSSFGNVRLANDEKVHAGFSDTDVKLQGKKIFKENLVATYLGFSNDLVYRYGYIQEIDTVFDLEKEDIKQSFSYINADVQFKSTYKDSTHLNYDAKVDYGYLFDNTKFNEHGLQVNAVFDKRYGKNDLGLDASFMYFNRNKTNISSYFTNALIMVSPYLKRSGEEWNFKVGLSGVYDDQSNFNFYPDIYMDFYAAGVYVIPYFGLKGKHEVNSYRSISNENPFIVPGLEVLNTRYPLMVYGGVKSQITPKLTTRVNIEYNVFEDMCFFINDYSDTLGNKFGIQTESGGMFRGNLEATYWHSESLGFMAKGNYYSYTLDSLDYAWHKPDFDITFSTYYSLKSKILVNLDMFVIGTRYVNSFSGTANKLNPYIDVNLGVEYKYSNLLSVFLKVNNLTASKYSVWNQYPTHRFNILAGFKYIL